MRWGISILHGTTAGAQLAPCSVIPAKAGIH